jgi:hypothetical protein
MADAMAAKSLHQLYAAAAESLSKLYVGCPIFCASPLAMDLIQIKSSANGVRVS